MSQPAYWSFLFLRNCETTVYQYCETTALPALWHIGGFFDLEEHTFSEWLQIRFIYLSCIYLSKLNYLFRPISVISV